MLELERIVSGAKLRGVAGPAVVEVVRVEWIGSDALNVVYRGNDGPTEVLLYREAQPRLELVQASRAFGFDGDGETFRVASEAQRIRLAHLFDPYLAVHSSRIEPLPHQITADQFVAPYEAGNGGFFGEQGQIRSGRGAVV
jgi:hypothetical protein